jgi:hypothetical protein
MQISETFLIDLVHYQRMYPVLQKRMHTISTYDILTDTCKAVLSQNQIDFICQKVHSHCATNDPPLLCADESVLALLTQPALADSLRHASALMADVMILGQVLTGASIKSLQLTIHDIGIFAYIHVIRSEAHNHQPLTMLLGSRYVGQIELEYSGCFMTYDQQLQWPLIDVNIRSSTNLSSMQKTRRAFEQQAKPDYDLYLNRAGTPIGSISTRLMQADWVIRIRNVEICFSIQQPMQCINTQIVQNNQIIAQYLKIAP